MRKLSFLVLVFCIQQPFSYAMPQKEIDVINTGSFVIDCRVSTYTDGKKFVCNNTLMKHNDSVYEKVSGLQQLEKNVNYGGSVKRVVYAPFSYGSIKNSTDLWLLVDCYGANGRIHNQGLHTGINKSAYGDFEQMKTMYPKYAIGILNIFFVHPDIKVFLHGTNKAVATAYGVDNFEGKSLSYYDYQYNDSANKQYKLRYYFDGNDNLVAIINLQSGRVSVMDNINVRNISASDIKKCIVPKDYKFWEIGDLRNNPYSLKVDYGFMSNLMLGKVELHGYPKEDEKDVL